MLGARHGFDADHLAAIDGLTRYNARTNSALARFCGALFSRRHGLVVCGVAITERFGDFLAAFHAAHRDAWSINAGYPVRRTLCNLYHVLNHFNLFGEGYGAEAEVMIGQLLVEAAEPHDPGCRRARQARTRSSGRRRTQAARGAAGVGAISP